MFSAELSSRGERLHKTNSAAERTLLGAVGGYTGTLQVAVLPPLLCRSMIKTRRQRRRALPKMRKQQMPAGQADSGSPRSQSVACQDRWGQGHRRDLTMVALGTKCCVISGEDRTIYNMCDTIGW
jgi:hypothetical protein